MLSCDVHLILVGFSKCAMIESAMAKVLRGGLCRKGSAVVVIKQRSFCEGER